MELDLAHARPRLIARYSKLAPRPPANGRSGRRALRETHLAVLVSGPRHLSDEVEFMGVGVVADAVTKVAGGVDDCLDCSAAVKAFAVRCSVLWVITASPFNDPRHGGA
jgi:hypothetical protein